MSDKLGPVTFGKTEEHIFLGREFAQHSDFSEATAVVIDSEIRSFLDKAEDTAKRILSTQIDKLHKLAAILLEKEIIDGKDVDDVIGRPGGNFEPAAAPAPTGG
jgi:cell division protease FtsH